MLRKWLCLWKGVFRSFDWNLLLLGQNSSKLHIEGNELTHCFSHHTFDSVSKVNLQVPRNWYCFSFCRAKSNKGEGEKRMGSQPDHSYCSSIECCNCHPNIVQLIVNNGRDNEFFFLHVTFYDKFNGDHQGRKGGTKFKVILMNPAIFVLNCELNWKVAYYGEESSAGCHWAHLSKLVASERMNPWK